VSIAITNSSFVGITSTFVADPSAVMAFSLSEEEFSVSSK
jgi:hypothetical protein